MLGRNEKANKHILSNLQGMGFVVLNWPEKEWKEIKDTTILGKKLEMSNI